MFIKSTTFNGSCFKFNDSIRLVNEVIQKGILDKASDIHIRENLDQGILEYRVDGILRNENLPKGISIKEIIARIKIISKLNVAEKRLPQDSSFSFEFDGNKYDIRVATLPSVTGESIVMRILNSTLDDISLKALGFDEGKEEILRRVCKRKNGLILVTGPTGSGKSTTLMSLINILNDGKKKIISIEDPVENRMEGIVQVQVKEEIGLSFDNVLRTVLRSDPDVIVISEIRDEITAAIAIRASLTGHLVLATLHTNDVISTFARLIDMKIPKYLLLDSILCILSQRLIQLDEYIGIKKRVCVSEILEFDDYTCEIFSKHEDRLSIENMLKNIQFVTLEDDIKRRCEYEKDNSI